MSSPEPWGWCTHCGDGTEEGDDPNPNLCAMCALAGRTPAMRVTVRYRETVNKQGTVVIDDVEFLNWLNASFEEGVEPYASIQEYLDGNDKSRVDLDLKEFLESEADRNSWHDRVETPVDLDTDDVELDDAARDLND